MTSIWSHRPQLVHLLLFYAAYVLGCGYAKVLGIVPGTNISIWLPGGLFVATLIVTPARSWPWWVLVGCLGEMTGQALWFRSPVAAGLLIYLGNVLEAVVGAWLVIRVCGRHVRLETLREVLTFVVLGAAVSSVLSATVGSATLEHFSVKGQTFSRAWPLWWLGDFTGILLVTPLALVVFQNWQKRERLSPARWVEVGVLAVIFVGATALSLSGYLPFAFIIMPPLLWAAVRFEFKGAAISLTILALVTAVLTMSGGSQFIGDAETQRHKQFVLQAFLAISAFTALVVAAISRQLQMAMLTLRQSERSLRDLIETLPTHIWCTAPDGRFIYFSQQLRDFLGFNFWDRSRPINVLSAIIHPDDLNGVVSQYARCLATGEPYALKHRLRRADGQYRWVESRAAAMRNSDGRIQQWNGVCLDIDDQVRAEERLRGASDKLAQATRAASLSELSASIAHEVNQPLAAIVANSHACQRWLSAEPSNIERAKITVERIIRDANSAADVVSRIRALFRQSPDARSSEDVNRLIREVCRLMADEVAARNVRVETELEPDLPLLALDRVQVQQVLVNLIRNAIEAMDGVADGARVLHIRSRREDPEAIRIEVRDTGAGFKDAQRVFEPFFTTKPNGMGMGLAISRSIVEAHGGRLWLASSEARGAVVAFTLPLAVADVREPAAAAAK